MVDWELERAEDGASAVGEKYEPPRLRSPGETAPLEKWVCREAGGSGIGKRGGLPAPMCTELPLPPVADRPRRLVLDAFRETEKSEAPGSRDKSSSGTNSS